MGKYSSYIIKMIVVAFAALSAAQLITLLVVERSFLEKYQSISMFDWSGYDWIIAACSMVAGLCFAMVLTPSKERLNKIDHRSGGLGDLLFLAAIVLFLANSILMIWFPETFLYHVKEVRIISLSQETSIFIGLSLLIASTLRATSVRLPAIFKIPGWVIMCAITAGVLLLFLEEISYGQHLFGWGTPEMFSGNYQSETNLHNFYTNHFEVVYYWGAVICFMILPLAKLLPISKQYPAIFFYVPPVEFAMAAVPIGTLVYISWSIVLIQFQFFLVAAIFMLLYQRSENGIKLRLGAVLLSFAISLVSLILYGNRLMVGYETSEIRELAIAIFVAAYSVWIFMKIKQLSAEQPIERQKVASSLL